ncbi:MAG: amidohydrolase family protein [Saprospiraceae bacterium]|nr:amidohydrolase family protein [Saprospiraceae bacterium]
MVAQETFPVNGVMDERTECYAIIHANVWSDYNNKVENAVLILRKGMIESVGDSLMSLPKDAVVLDFRGKNIYPSFIDLYADYGITTVKDERSERRSGPQYEAQRKGAFAWNDAIRSDFDAYANFRYDEKASKELRESGFGAVLSHRMDGISRGTGTLVFTGVDKEHQLICKEKVTNHFSFSKGSSGQEYPSSLMGSIALLRQSYLDGIWYAKKGHDEEKNFTLEAWNSNQNLIQIFETSEKWDILRAHKISEEFSQKYVFKGNGDEYQRVKEIAQLHCPIIIPVNFPDPFEIKDPYDVLNVDLSTLMHWEYAPQNAVMLSNEGVEIAFTAFGLKRKQDFLKNIRRSIERGLSEEAALKALTYTPAKILKVEDKLGALKKGYYANFLITQGNLFSKEGMLLENWVNGKRTILKNLPFLLSEGTYELSVNTNKYEVRVKPISNISNEYSIYKDSTSLKSAFNFEGNILNFSFTPDTSNLNQSVRLTGIVSNDKGAGTGTWTDGSWVNWSLSMKATKASTATVNKDSTLLKSDTAQYVSQPVIYPFGAYGSSSLPLQETTLIKNATLWTNEQDGILKQTDILISNGKIEKIGNNIAAPKGAVIIDGTGKHVTPGIIDEHTHIAIKSGVNEGTQSSSAEVRIGDVIDPEDINIYRQLAGGVTTAQQLHGSANPIGGQSSLIKLRWGVTAEQMKFKNADAFIKFALGENVKQSNWGELYRVRFPQSRMGVEQVYEDMFTRAEEYAKLKSSTNDYRKDLDLEAIQEIIEHKRFITCHSYVQSEINMLMKVADRHKFHVNTFTHILEGYKVADKMKAHGAGGSTFSDWWAYKFEVYEAIPYNGVLMHNAGITVAYNSDDAEMARRLNQEAAKAVRYGDLSEEEALKFVTLNPAKLLHIDDQVGSLKVGKDADLVVWSDHPLSVYARVEQTFVDGIRYFDINRDILLRKQIQNEKSRIIEKMIDAKKSGSNTQPAASKPTIYYHCDDIGDEYHQNEDTHH